MKFLTPKEQCQEIAQRIRSIRCSRNISQAELSERCGISYGSYRRFESTGEIAFLSLVKVAQILDLSSDLEELFVRKSYQSLDEIERGTKSPNTTRRAGRSRSK